MSPAGGSRVSRPEVAGLVLASAAGPRSSRPNPSWPSRVLISYTDRPWRRSSMTRPRAASFLGALLRPGVPGGANTVTLPARRSRTRDATGVLGIPGGIGCLLQRLPLIRVGAQRLIPPLVHLPGE